MKKQKILFLITKSNWGGAQRYVYELATNLPSEHYEVVVAFGGSGPLKEKLAAADIRTCTVQNFQRNISILKELRAFFELRKLLNEERPDIIHLNSSKAVAMGALVGRLCRIPHIVSTIHGWPFLEQRSFLWRSIAWLGSWISALLSHHVILVSKHDAEQRMPFIDRRCTVIHTALPPIEFKPRAAARNELFDTKTQNTHEHDLWVGTIGELTPNKNLKTAIDAVRTFNETHEQKIFYTIISDGELRDQLATYIRTHDASHWINLAGYIDNARTYLPAFDIFLLPSLKEGLPYAILEAGAAGVPVVASRVGGIPEVIEHDVSGTLIDPHDHTTITRALHTLARSPALRAAYAERLEHTVTEKFSLEHMLEATEAVYATTRE